MKIEISETELLEILMITSDLALHATHGDQCHFNEECHPELDKCTCGLQSIWDRMDAHRLF